MPKPKTDAQRAFLKAISEMTANFRRDIDEPYALIGKAVRALAMTGAPLTVESIAAQITALGGPDSPQVGQAISLLTDRS